MSNSIVPLIKTQIPQQEASAFTTLCQPTHSEYRAALDVVKQFIVDRKRILYGGTAIDHALKLRGNRLYDDDAVPDLDFYSPENIQDAYDLADIFHNMGFEEARAIVGIHPTIMKVDIGGNNWVCDVAYFSPELYRTLPTLTYNGMLSVHMDYQRVDMHSSLAFPFDNPPSEVIFDRWTKDVERFTMADKAYPLSEPAGKLPECVRCKVPKKWIVSYVASGFLAFSLYCTTLKTHGGLLEARCEATAAHFAFDTYANRCDLCTMSLSALIEKLQLTSYVRRSPLMNLVSSSLVAVNPQNVPVCLHAHSTHGRLLSIQTLTLPALGKIRVVSVQYLLRWFLAMYFSEVENKTGLRSVYLAHYVALLNLAKAHKVAAGEPNILGLSIETYGNLNLNAPTKNALNRIRADLGDEQRYRQPQGYIPAKAAHHEGSSDHSARVHPKIDLTAYHFYQEDGKITKVV